ncbi:MAG: hypothetical protein DA330_02105 [Nitrososphaera sp.]|nr:hypothetical protein [Nitrososphaera sp.]
MKQFSKRPLIVVSTVFIYIEDGESGGFAGAAADKEFGMNAGYGFENLGVGKAPLLVGRIP